MPAEDEDQLALVPQLLDSLSERSRDVIFRRFYDQMTLIEVGDLYNLSRERVRQIEKQAIKFMASQLGVT